RRRSTAEPCPPWLIVSSVINILPLKAQVKHWVTPSPPRHYPLKFEITFCVRGVKTAPCGVPCLVSDHWPSSDTPALSHFWIRRSILRSATLCSTNFTVHSGLMLSKK